MWRQCADSYIYVVLLLLLCCNAVLWAITLPSQLSLESDRSTFMQHSKYTREQELLLKDELTYKSAWYVHIHSISKCKWSMNWCTFCQLPRRILCFNQEDRLETEGTPVPVSLCIHLTKRHMYMHACDMYNVMFVHNNIMLVERLIFLCLRVLPNLSFPLQANRLVFINHCKTNQHLSLHTEWMHRWVIWYRWLWSTGVDKIQNDLINETLQYLLL